MSALGLMPVRDNAEQEKPLKLVIVSDAWYPQVNGVVRTVDTIRQCLIRMGHEVRLITPDSFRSVPCPTYPEIRLAINAWPRVKRLLERWQPDSVFIATEGPLGLAARRHCRHANLGFTTSYCTRFPEYVRLRFPVPKSWSYRYLRWFHNAADAVLVTTPTLQQELKGRGFANTTRWNLGVDTKLFRPQADTKLDQLPRPVFLYVGRLAVEKNVEAFLNLRLDGSKVVVGGGPALEHLRRKYPDAHFTGEKHGEELARYYASGDALVFPSRTDTFGLVMLEALACGTPVAAYPTPGPLDVITDPRVGVLDEDLRNAALKAVRLNRQDCRDFALRFSWDESARSLVSNLRDNCPTPRAHR